MSGGFAGSETKSFAGVSHDVEMRLSGASLVGRVEGKHGSAEIHKTSQGQYVVHSGQKSIAQAGDMATARAHAQAYVSQPPTQRRMARLARLAAKKVDDVGDLEVWVSHSSGMSKFAAGEYGFGIKSKGASKWTHLSGYDYKSEADAKSAGVNVANSVKAK